MREKSTLEIALPDPVLSSVELPLHSIFFPFGFPLELSTNSHHVIEAAAEGWSRFDQQFDVAPVKLQVGVTGSGRASLPQRSTFCSRDHLMLCVADGENFAVSDFKQNFAFAWITETVAADHALVRYRFLVSAGLTLIEQNSCASLHCGLVERDGCGVALLGDSYAGKSTLSYACSRNGWRFASDDGVMLVRDHPGRYGAGDPFTLRLREDAKSLFPELSHQMAVMRPNGKCAIEIFTQDLPIQTAIGCSIDHMVFLNRREPGPARLRRYPADETLDWCRRYSTFGTAEVREAQLRCYERLLTADIWEMTYGDLDGAIECLERLVDSGG